MSKPAGGTMKIVVNNECLEQTLNTLFEDHPWDSDPYKLWWTKTQVFNVDNVGFIAARDANKIVHDYAVTKLPFVLLCDEEDKPYASVYSEEGPITIERINAKS